MVSDLKTLAHMYCKIAAHFFIVVNVANIAWLAGFFGIGATIRIGQDMLCVPYAGFKKYIFTRSWKI